ncbi:hypothetical protein P8891_12070 [Bacillus atrophaeus]|uniref:hypothetical protein n=1 Tax=Bacillus atrophaeus TaxID=1452 RepID=UPI002282B50C|nr:hypothetical protein [Bacillus atrophaeus]MCY7948342.1 hypothetical protein [Bacillus atrophaeus]MCY8098609.1 hypothetical protein [Bacillus atrophaeus]MCY9167860.1 hypothetical protein [Bacillus atrophaeus]MEC0741799.1 hypothetical protein [Bacillus atrophaeus]MEC0744887.1 hypothetical protein [Bacillus atrophaeus]
MNIPLRIVEEEKTDEYVRLQNRRDYFKEKHDEALEAARKASRTLYSATVRRQHSYGDLLPNGFVIEISNAAKKCLSANRKVEHVEAILFVVENDIKRLEECV